MSGAAYRRELDGLRAVSVLVILLYHLELTAFTGGFVGVDVFFVISGFLITGIIMQDLGHGQFSLRQFYLRRFARIVPALVATVLFSLLAAIVLYPPPALVHAAEQGLAALFSVSNIYYWLYSGYWAPAAKNELFLHTWSLGVEEQFYLVYPLLLMICYRLHARLGVVALLTIMSIVGVAASQQLLHSNNSAAFFFTPLRFYEFALGGLGSMLLKRMSGDRLCQNAMFTSFGTLIGLAMIFYAALSFNSFTPFPGVNSLYPTVGALLVILSGDSVAARGLLANPLMRQLGKISYALYLVHWPVIVLYRYYYGPPHSPYQQLALMLVVYLLGLLLNRAVERRYRLARGDAVTLSGLPAHRAMRRAGVAIALVIGLASASIIGAGLPWRLPEKAQKIAAIDVHADLEEQRQFVEAQCVPRRKVFCGRRRIGGLNIMLLADSRGADQYIAIKTAYPYANIYLSMTIGCPPVFNKDIARNRFYRKCPELNQKRLDKALQLPPGDIVYLAMDFNDWRGRFIVETAKKLVDSGKRVYVLGESDFLSNKSPTEIVVDQLRFNPGPNYVDRFVMPDPFGIDTTYNAQFAEVGAVYISTRDFYYQDGYRLHVNDGSDLLSYDGKHLTMAGARAFGEYLAVNYDLGSPRSNSGQR